MWAFDLISCMCVVLYIIRAPVQESDGDLAAEVGGPGGKPGLAQRTHVSLEGLGCQIAESADVALAAQRAQVSFFLHDVLLRLLDPMAVS